MSLIWTAIIATYVTLGTGVDFKVYWNVPSDSCSKVHGINVTNDLLNHNVLVNNGERFIGDKIVIFYENKLGKYPYMDPEKGDVNGGMPQLANLSEHLELARTNIEKMIPNPNFDGLGIIDWEKWRPIYSYNWKTMAKYKTRTMNMVRRENPFLRKKFIRSIAENQWEECAKEWMLKTLLLAKEMRPKARWCYYSFPDCYNYEGIDQLSQFLCSKRIQEQNDRLSWLWEASTALCPSIYFYNFQENYNIKQQLWYLYGRIFEARRIASPNKLIYPYINYKNFDTRVDVPKEHFWRRLTLSAFMGVDGVVIWGSSSYVEKKEDCEALALYVREVIDPSVFRVSLNFNKCSESVCSGLGRCTWSDEISCFWRYFADYKSLYFKSEEIVCRCQRNEGRYCNLTNCV